MARRVPGAGEYLFDEARRAVSDIRHKLFEEAWFGRHMRHEQSQAILPLAEAKEHSSSRAFEEAWGRAAPERGSDNERDTREKAPELER